MEYMEFYMGRSQFAMEFNWLNKSTIKKTGDRWEITAPSKGAAVRRLFILPSCGRFDNFLNIVYVAINQKNDLNYF